MPICWKPERINLMSEFYGKDGKKIHLFNWGRKIEDSKYRIIKQDVLTNGKMISTVWLGINHCYGGGTPLIFETMVFSFEGKALVTRRYETIKEAREGHKAIVRIEKKNP